MIDHVTPPRVQYILQYIDSNDKIQNVDVTKDFSNWKSFETDVIRDNLTGAYVQIQNGGIVFTGDSYTLLKSIYESKGVNAVANLIVNLRNDTFPNVWTYTQKIVLNLNFTTYERTYTEIVIHANQNGLMQYVKANGGQKYDISLEELDAGYLPTNLETLIYTLGNVTGYPIISTLGGTVGYTTWGYFVPPVLVVSQIVNNTTNYLLQYSNELCKVNVTTWQQWDLNIWNNITGNTPPFFLVDTAAKSFNFTIKGIINLTFDHQVTNVKLSLRSTTRTSDVITPINLGNCIQDGITFSLSATLDNTINVTNATANTSYYLQISFDRVLASTSENIVLLNMQFAPGSYIQVQEVPVQLSTIIPEVLSYDGLSIEETTTYFTGEVASNGITYPNINLDSPVVDSVNGGYKLAFLPSLSIENRIVNPSYNNFLTFYDQPLMQFVPTTDGTIGMWYEWSGTGWCQSNKGYYLPIFSSSANGEITLSIKGTLAFNFGNPVNAGALYLVPALLGNQSAYNLYNYLNGFKICDIPANNSSGEMAVSLDTSIQVNVVANASYYIACVFNYSTIVHLYYKSFQFTSGSAIQVKWNAELTVPLKIPLIKEQNLLQALVNKITETNGATYVVSYSYIEIGVNKTAIQNVTLGAVQTKDVTISVPSYVELIGSGNVIITITRPLSAGITYTDPKYIQFPTGSIKSIPFGLIINFLNDGSADGLPITYQIDTNNSLPGSYLITYYFTNNKQYPDSISFNFTLTNQGTSFTYPQNLAPDQISASPVFASGSILGGTFSATLLSPNQIQSDPCGLVIDSNTGIIDLTKSAIYQYTAKIDNHVEEIRILAGESIRGFMSQFIHTSLNDFINYIRSVWGYEYEINGNLIHFAPRNTFFQNVESLSIPQINNYKLSINKENVFWGV